MFLFRRADVAAMSRSDGKLSRSIFRIREGSLNQPEAGCSGIPSEDDYAIASNPAHLSKARSRSSMMNRENARTDRRSDPEKAIDRRCLYALCGVASALPIIFCGWLHGDHEAHVWFVGRHRATFRTALGDDLHDAADGAPLVGDAGSDHGRR